MDAQRQARMDAGDYFALFGLERRFDLDEAELQSRYLELSRQTHPDFAGADAEAQMRAMEVSARVNEAYRVLADPEQRGKYLLTLVSGAEGPGEHALTPFSEALPEGFLEEMMGVHEQLEEARERGDERGAAGIEERARREREECIGRIAELFAEVRDGQPGAPAALQAVRMQLNALRYIQRLLDRR
jgi:molecular chaperone HscB